jgi:hypothetical protein
MEPRGETDLLEVLPHIVGGRTKTKGETAKSVSQLEADAAKLFRPEKRLQPHSFFSVNVRDHLHGRI